MRTMPNLRTAIALLAACFFFAVLKTECLAQTAPTVRASEVLPRELLQGPGYLVNEAVVIQDNRYLFTVNTDYGDFTALGLPMFELRLREHFAIERARKVSKSPLIFKGVVETVRDTPAGARTLLTDPIGSLRRVPHGLKQSVNGVIDPLERRAGSSVRRELAISVGADPETRNPILGKLLDQISLRKSVGKIGTQIGIGMAIPGLSLLSTNEEIRQQVRKRGPRELAQVVQDGFVKLGVSPQTSQQFAHSKKFTSTEKLLYLWELQELRGVQGLDQLVATSMTVTSEARWLSQLQQLKVLTDLHQQKPIQHIHMLRVPVAQLENGMFVGVAAVDIVQRTEQLSAYIKEFRQANPTQEVSLLVTGQVSPAARSSMDKADIEVFELAHNSSTLRR